MSFSLGAFARGFGEAYSADKAETKDRITKLVDTAYNERRLEAKELRKERKAQRKMLREYGAQFKNLGISNEAQIVGLLGGGAKAAEKNIAILEATAKEYGNQGKVFDANAFVKGVGIAGLTLEDGINSIMGKAAPADQNYVMDIPGVQKREGILSSILPDPTKFAASLLEERGSISGESMADLVAETGDRIYGDIGEVSLDRAKLYIPGEDRELDRKLKESQLATAEAQREYTKSQTSLHNAKTKKIQSGAMEPAELQQFGNGVNKSLGLAMVNAGPAMKDYDPLTNKYVFSSESRELHAAFFVAQAQTISDVKALVQGQYAVDGQKLPKMPYDQAIQWTLENIIPDRFSNLKADVSTPPMSAIPGDGASTSAQRTGRADVVKSDIDRFKALFPAGKNPSDPRKYEANYDALVEVLTNRLGGKKQALEYMRKNGI